MGENGVGKSDRSSRGWPWPRASTPTAAASNIARVATAPSRRCHEHLALRWGRRRPKRDFFLRAETLLDTVAAYEAIGGTYAGLTRLSHGESVTTLLERHGRRGLLLFADEPEDGLSVTGQLALLSGSTPWWARVPSSVIATHSPILPALPGARTYELDEAAPPRSTGPTPTPP